MLHDFVQPELGAAWVTEAETSQRPTEALHSPLRETTPPVSSPPGNSPPHGASPRHFSFSPGVTETQLDSDVTLTDLSHAIPSCSNGSLHFSPGSSSSLDSSLDLTMFPPPPPSGDVMSQEPGYGILSDCPQFACDLNQPIDSTYTHKLPQRNKAHKPKRKRRITSDQRSAANQRERKRMVTINEAFEQLQARIPTFSYEKRLSRIETLKLAIGYIWFMREVLNGAHPQCINLSYFIDSLPLLSTKIDRWDLCGQS